MTVRIVCISDTHGSHKSIGKRLPEADYLIFAGDMCNAGYLHEVQYFADWLTSIRLFYKEIIIIAGNHDFPFEREKIAAKKYIEDSGAIYLENNDVILDGMKIWGSPATREFCNWAFNYTEEQLVTFWKEIPEDVNVLVTHSMPIDILDYTPLSDENVGEIGLFNRINQLKDLKLYIGGHLHFYGGKILKRKGVTYVNASVCDEGYKPIQGPVVLDIDLITKEIKHVTKYKNKRN